MNRLNTKVPSNLMLTALLSSGITNVVSICYIVLSILGLIYRFNCNAVDVIDSTQIFWSVIYTVYIQSEDCEHHIMVEGLTQSYTVFIFLAITLSFSAMTLITGIVLAAKMNKKTTQYINVYVYAYIFSWVGSLVVDLTFGTHLGMDFTYLTDKLSNSTNYHPIYELGRQGAFFLMAISLKGFAIHAINLVLVLLMIVYASDYQNIVNRDEHSIHKMGALNAFEQPRRHDDNWRNPDMYAGPSFSRGQTNNAYVDEEPPRTPVRNDYYQNSRLPGSFRRSDSWRHQQSRPQSAFQSLPSSSSSRPFSYLEEVRRPAPVKAPAAPVAAESWRGAWPPPPVPAPDYSPHGPRRLKSALKPNYM